MPVAECPHWHHVNCMSPKLSRLSCQTCLLLRYLERVARLVELRVALKDITFERDARERGLQNRRHPEGTVQRDGIIAEVEAELTILGSRLESDVTGTQLGEFLENLVTPKVKLESKIKELRNGLSEQESELTFLRLKLNSDAGRGISEGDVVIIVHNRVEEPLYAHKFVLSSKSPVFCKMFETEMLKKEQVVVHIDDSPLEVMRAVIKFCYDAQINFTDQVPAEEVLEGAHKYEIPLLWKICEEHLTTTINDGNLAKRLKLARTHQAEKLQAATSKYFKDNFDSVLSRVVGEL